MMRGSRLVRCFVFLLCALVSLALIPASALSAPNTFVPKYQTKDELAGKNFAYVNGSVYNQYVRTSIPDTTESFYGSLADCIAAVEAGKVDAAVALSSGCQLAVNRKGGVVAMLPERIADVQEGFFFSHGNPLAAQFNDVIDQFWENGTIAWLQEKWEGANDEVKTLPAQDWDAPKGTLKFSTSGAYEPVSYIGKDGVAMGYDVELALLIAKELGYRLDVSVSSIDACIASVQAGKVDFGGEVTITEERAELVEFTDPILDAYIAAIVPTASVIKDELEVSSLNELGGLKLGAVTGSVYPQIVAERVEGVKENKFAYFDSASDATAALKAGKIDGLIEGKAVGELVVSNNPELGMIGESIADDDIGMCLRKGSPLTSLLDKLIEGYRADGTLEALREKWMGADEAAKTLPQQDWDAPNGTLKVIGSTLEPMCYVTGRGEVKGYEVELVLMMAKALGYKATFTTAPFSGLLGAVQAGKADLAIGHISITEERREQVDLTVPDYVGGIMVVVRKGVGEVGESGSFLGGLSRSFYKTFVQENRWQLILCGLGVTLVIALCAGVLGALLGYLTVLARRSDIRWLKSLVDIYQSLMGGIPIVVVLMALYYVVFGSIDIAGEIVAIIAFALSFGSVAGTTMWTAVQGIDEGQTESGLALGYTPGQVFHKIVFPQAAQHFLPQLIGQSVSLLKETAVVGYIAVTDLTRASDLIRARTMDAFFPIVATAIIYYVCCRILVTLLSGVRERLRPENSPFDVEGE